MTTKKSTGLGIPKYDKKSKENMRKPELQNRREGLHSLLRAYRALLVESRDPVVPRIVRNGQRLEQMRNGLNRGYGSVSGHISRLGGDERQFQIALSATELPRRGPHIDVALQTLEQILGRLEHTSNDEFNSIFTLRQPEARGPGQKVFSDFWNWFQKHVLSTVIVGLIIAGLVYWLGWN